MSHGFGFLIESMVAVLLLLTILYCVRLSKQLRLLRADEQSLRATIAELVTATEIAEQTLGAHIASADQLSADLARQLSAGEDMLGKLARIAGVVRPSSAGAALAAAAPPDAKSVAAAAQAFAERTKARVKGIAA